MKVNVQLGSSSRLIDLFKLDGMKDSKLAFDFDRFVTFNLIYKDNFFILISINFEYYLILISAVIIHATQATQEILNVFLIILLIFLLEK